MIRHLIVHHVQSDDVILVCICTFAPNCGRQFTSNGYEWKYFKDLTKTFFKCLFQIFVQVREVNYTPLSGKNFMSPPSSPGHRCIPFEMYGSMLIFGHAGLYRYTNVFLVPPYICRLKCLLPTGRIFFNKQFE